MESQVASTTQPADGAIVARAAERLRERLTAPQLSQGQTDPAGAKRLGRLEQAVKTLTQTDEQPAVPELDMAKPAIRIAVVGGNSRQEENRAGTYAALENVRHAIGDRPIVVAHASDANYKTPTAMWADAYRYGRTQYTANWQDDNRMAGVERNNQVIEQGQPDMVIALPDGNAKSAAHLLKTAEEKGIMTVGDGDTWPDPEEIRGVAQQTVADVDSRTSQLDKASILEMNRESRGHVANVGPLPVETRPAWPIAKEMGDPPADYDPDATDREVRVLVTGARRHRAEHIIEKALDELLDRAGNIPLVVVQGGEPGVETVAVSWAQSNGVEIDVYPAEWKTEVEPATESEPAVLRNNPAAGRERNEQMFSQGRPDMVLTFPEGNDNPTRTITRLAEARNIPIEEIGFITRHSPDGKKVNIAALAKTPADREPGAIAPGGGEPRERPDGVDEHGREANGNGQTERTAPHASATPVRTIVRGAKPIPQISGRTTIDF